MIVKDTHERQPPSGEVERSTFYCLLFNYRLQFKTLLDYHDDHDYYNES